MDWNKIAMGDEHKAELAAERFADEIEERTEAFKGLIADFRRILREATDDDAS